MPGMGGRLVRVTTFDAVLTRVLKDDPGRPLVTFYDDATGERIELSRITYANWVAKAASLLVDEHDLDPRRHAAGRPARALAGPGLPRRRLDRRTGGLRRTTTRTQWCAAPTPWCAWATRAAELPVLACALLPLGVRFAEPLPEGVHDVGVEVWSQPDAFAPYDPPADTDPAYDLGGEHRTHAELLERGRRR